MNYKKLNNITGWLVFAIATAVYLLTIEPTASWWDCGEFIATSYKLEIGHPPGNSLFMMVGRLFTLLAMGDTSKVAVMMNAMSALASSFTILFLFWSITCLAKKLYGKAEELTVTQRAIVMGSGIVGALAYTFSDSFWFSAVEGEVYASSAFFTAFVFWAILKWEEHADEKYADKWIVLIAYMMGLSIGVHLLNLLVIPAIGFVYYFRKYKPTLKGIMAATAISVGILAVIQAGIIGGLISMASQFELFFVNSVGMGYHSGLMIFVLFIAALIVFGIYWSIKKQLYLLNLIVLCFAFIVMGYASYAVVLIRSGQNTPLNENKPDDIFALQSYVNREQYGDRPLLYGQCYNAELKEVVEEGPVYKRMNGKYVVVDHKRSYKWDEENSMLFPRMYSSEGHHKEAYKNWTGCDPNSKPTFSQNLAFFFKYQIGWMYWRYFLWNFAGKQNDIQGHGNAFEGNWISGISIIDQMFLGPQDNLPDSLKNNKGRNTFYMLPLILGLIGTFFHFKKNKHDAWVVMILFFMTGLAIIIYLNQYPYQPRERDYAYAGSFYAFAIWIGLGVAAIVDYIAKLLKKNPTLVSVLAVTAVSTVLVPGIMAKEGWDDHDRSGKTACRDFAEDYLQSCEKNAILFTNGDNDTFPLWYVQEVEGIRTDVRVVNYTLLGGDWHIHQQYLKSYESDPLPLTLKKEDYNQGTNDYLGVYERVKGAVELNWLVEKFIANPSTKALMNNGTESHYLPTDKFIMTIDSARVCSNGTVDLKRYTPAKYLSWELKKGSLYKHEFMVYDLLATNKFKRPIYFASPESVRDILPVGNVFYKREGFTSRLIPGLPINDKISPDVNTDKMYTNMMTKFKWGNLNKKGVYCDPESARMVMLSRSMFAQLANALYKEGKVAKAKKALDKCIELFPDRVAAYDMYTLAIADAYYRIGETKKANAIINRLYEISDKELKYFVRFINTRLQADATGKIEENMEILNNLIALAKNNNQNELSNKFIKRFNEIKTNYYNPYQEQEMPLQQAPVQQGPIAQ